MNDEEKIIEVFKKCLKNTEKSELIELLTLIKDESIADDFLRVTLIYDVIEDLIKEKEIKNAKFSFNYEIKGRFTMLPLFFEIESESLEEAYNQAVQQLSEEYGMERITVYRENYNNLDKRGRLKNE